MKLLRCPVCCKEMNIVSNERAINKKVVCQGCGFDNMDEDVKKEPEVVIIRKRG
jgi:hypothetical protein